jgi:MATE family multidrug resistance protein
LRKLRGMANSSDTQPQITHRRVLALALPILAANVTVPILGAVDTAVVGQMAEAAPIGAVGIGAIILSAVYWVFGFLRMGTTGLVSQARGARNKDETINLLARALLMGCLAGVGLLLLQPLIFWGAFQLAPTSAEVEALATSYMRIRIWSAPAAIMLYGLTGWLIAMERTRAVLALQLLMNGLNIGFDLWFVLGFGWGVNGVAVATLLAEWGGLIFGLWIVREQHRQTVWRRKENLLNRQALRTMGIVNFDILIRSLLLQAIFVSFLFISADFGDVTLAANQVLVQFLSICAYALDGFAYAAQSLVGQAFGARDRLGVRRAAQMTSVWAVIATLLLVAGFAFEGSSLIDYMTNAQDVRAEARVYLPYLVASPILALAAYMMDGIFIGATRSRDMRQMMQVSFAIYAVAAWGLTQTLGNHGLWLALIVSLVARGLTLAVRYPALERAAE